MQILDASPGFNNTTISIGGQCVSGRALAIACSADGQRAYLGGISGVWRSDDRGVTWRHLEWPQPPSGVFTVPGALPCTGILDLAVSPGSPEIVLAAATDGRVPSLGGIYRSADGGATWTLAHAFQGSGIPSRLAFAPDNPQIIYAAGQFAIAISTNGGVTWTETKPNAADQFFHVVCGPAQGAARNVYAAGFGFNSSGQVIGAVYFSLNGGTTWVSAEGSPPTIGQPSYGNGVSARALSINPSNSNIIYILDGGRTLWRGDFTAFQSTQAAVWTQLPAIPRGPGRTPSGATYVVAHVGPSGDLCLIAGDQERVYLSIGEPSIAGNWTWIDQTHHADPHGLALTPDFDSHAAGAKGTIFAINDGGVYTSTDGANTWTHGSGLTSLDVVNIALGVRAGKTPTICIGCGDNWGFFSPDGGGSWKTQEYDGGDNDCCFTDQLQSSRLIVFAPRDNSSIHLYKTGVGNVPDGSLGTGDLQVIPAPANVGNQSRAWNVVSWWYNFGYRPLVLTLAGETPRPDGDLVAIVFPSGNPILLRTTALTQVTSSSDWITTATAEGAGVKVFQQGPVLPDVSVSVVQASGGHDSPVFYISDADPTKAALKVPGQQRLWKWTAGMASWQLLVPGNTASSTAFPRLAQRFFVDPYRPNRIYLLDQSHVLRSENGGTNWVIDSSLEKNLTANGAFPFISVGDGSAQPVLLRDMAFDAARPNYRFAVGPAGVFFTTDGANWSPLLVSAASAIQPINCTYDSVSDFCNRSLYVSTSNRGLLRLTPLPPGWDFPIGSIEETSGRITFLRINDVSTGYGPPDDSIDAEVIFQLDSEPGKAFGIQLRTDANQVDHRGMLKLLRLAYSTNAPVLIDFIRESCTNGKVIRVALP